MRPTQLVQHRIAMDSKDLTQCPLRVVTYNVHKCRGLDRRVNPRRIVKVLRELDADVIALQEIFSFCRRQRAEMDQIGFIAREMGLHYCFGETCKRDSRSYGNALLSRFEIRETCNYDLSALGREPRGCLRMDVTLPSGITLHVFNVHLGTAFFERRAQARKLVSENVLKVPGLVGPRIILGDFNEWTKGTTTRLLREHFVSPKLRRHVLHGSRSYPGVLPFLHLDHIYFDPSFRLCSFTLHRSPTALVASDHLPLVADLFTVSNTTTMSAA
jgi:endonuclease/exonuclease/phosphatase family metal-dependent hydrolase